MHVSLIRRSMGIKLGSEQSRKEYEGKRKGNERASLGFWCLLIVDKLISVAVEGCGLTQPGRAAFLGLCAARLNHTPLHFIGGVLSLREQARHCCGTIASVAYYAAEAPYLLAIVFILISSAVWSQVLTAWPSSACEGLLLRFLGLFSVSRGSWA